MEEAGKVKHKPSDIQRAREGFIWSLIILTACMFFWARAEAITMQSCHGCLALTLSNSYPPGFCPLGYEVVKDGHNKSPKGECPRPETHADMIAIPESDDDD